MESKLVENLQEKLLEPESYVQLNKSTEEAGPKTNIMASTSLNNGFVQSSNQPDDESKIRKKVIKKLKTKLLEKLFLKQKKVVNESRKIQTKQSKKEKKIRNEKEKPIQAKKEKHYTDPTRNKSTKKIKSLKRILVDSNEKSGKNEKPLTEHIEEAKKDAINEPESLNDVKSVIDTDQNTQIMAETFLLKQQDLNEKPVVNEKAIESESLVAPENTTVEANQDMKITESELFNELCKSIIEAHQNTQIMTDISLNIVLNLKDIIKNPVVNEKEINNSEFLIEPDTSTIQTDQNIQISAITSLNNGLDLNEKPVVDEKMIKESESLAAPKNSTLEAITSLNNGLDLNEKPVVDEKAINKFVSLVAPKNFTLEIDQDMKIISSTSQNNGLDLSSKKRNGNPEFPKEVIKLNLQEDIQICIRNLNRRIRRAVQLEQNPDVDMAMSAMSDLNELPITRDILLKDHLQIIITLKKVKKYLASEALNKKAEDLFYKYKKIYFTQQISPA